MTRKKLTGKCKRRKRNPKKKTTGRRKSMPTKKKHVNIKPLIVRKNVKLKSLLVKGRHRSRHGLIRI